MVEPSYGVSPTAGQPRRLFIWPHYTVQGGRFAMGRRNAADTKNPCRSKQQGKEV